MKVLTGIVKFTINNDTINNDTFYEQHVLCEVDNNIYSNKWEELADDSDLQFYKNLYYTTKCKLDYIRTLYSTGYIPEGYLGVHIGKLIIEIIQEGVDELRGGQVLNDVNFVQDITAAITLTIAKNQH